jgi:hypothetical protein
MQQGRHVQHREFLSRQIIGVQFGANPTAHAADPVRCPIVSLGN